MNKDRYKYKLFIKPCEACKGTLWIDQAKTIDKSNLL